MTPNSNPKVLGGYREFRPPPPLDTCFERLWTFQGGTGRHRALPDPDVSIVLKGTANLAGSVYGWDIRVFGPVTKPRMFTPESGETLVAVTLKAEWVKQFLGTPGFEMADCMAPLADVNRPLAETLARAVEGARNPTGALPELTAALARQCPGNGAVNAVQTVAGLIRRAGGTAAVGGLIEGLHVSERHLLRVFRDAFGFGPKAFARSLRFLNAVDMADRIPGTDWAGIAAESGYFDQSHMIRDFRRFTGLTPACVLAERRAETALPVS